MEFYNVKKRKTVKVAEKDCKKIVYKRETANGIQERYAVRAVDNDGTNPTKFISKDCFEKLSCAVEKAPKKK